ncbi:hypothetical protein AB837_00350 [bacterium AB1]|nr:hypothetical protein AB837_00350 [bacterium AB1]
MKTHILKNKNKYNKLIKKQEPLIQDIISFVKENYKNIDHNIENIYINTLCQQQIHKINKKYRQVDSPATIISLVYQDYCIINICVHIICKKYNQKINKKNILNYIIHAITCCLIRCEQEKDNIYFFLCQKYQC